MVQTWKSCFISVAGFECYEYTEERLSCNLILNILCSQNRHFRKEIFFQHVLDIRFQYQFPYHILHTLIKQQIEL